MNYVEHTLLLQRISRLIRSRKTGKLSDLARTMDIPISTMKREMELLRTYGAKIGYSKIEKSYYYRNNFQFIMKIDYDEDRDDIRD